MGESPLLDLFPHKVCHHDPLHSRVTENPPIPLFPTSPRGVNECPARLPPLLLWYPGEHAIPPSINTVSQNRRRQPNQKCGPHLFGETTIEVVVLHCFQMAVTKLANGVMRPTSNRQIVRREDFVVKYQPSKEPALWFRLCLPELCGTEGRARAIKLAPICRGRRVLPGSGPSPRNGVRLRQQLHPLHDCPQRRKLMQLLK